jgi:hypothetical protein
LTTIEKDFKVKNGLLVTNGGSFGGAVTVGEPTESTHAATKAYVDSLDASIPVTSSAPSSPENGDLWFDTSVERLKVYYIDDWLTIATSNDLQDIPDHIHDTSIEGDGRITTIFWDGQWYNSPQIQSLDGGGPDSTTWDFVFDGGLATDNFN